jgi:RimJ/RimL family protein N-acetyltransferase
LEKDRADGALELAPLDGVDHAPRGVGTVAAHAAAHDPIDARPRADDADEEDVSAVIAREGAVVEADDVHARAIEAHLARGHNPRAKMLENAMSASFRVTREQPPARILYADDARSIEIRPWRPEDVAAQTACLQASVTELREFMPWAHAPITLEGQYKKVAAFLADTLTGGHFIAGIFGPKGEILGGAGLHPRLPLNPCALEIGYWAASEHAGQGHVSAAVRVLTLLAIRRFGCDRMQVTHDEANERSRRVVERCGFVYEGTMRNALTPATAEMVAQGFRGVGNVRLYAIVPSDLTRLDWVDRVEQRTRVFDALGNEQRI